MYLQREPLSLAKERNFDAKKNNPNGKYHRNIVGSIVINSINPCWNNLEIIDLNN
jgi:hypothetical protein